MSAQTPIILQTPTNLGTLHYTLPNTIIWSAVPPVASYPVSYRVLRSTTPGGETTIYATTTTNSFTDTNVTYGQTYYYEVQAVERYLDRGPGGKVDGYSLISSELAMTETYISADPLIIKDDGPVTVDTIPFQTIYSGTGPTVGYTLIKSLPGVTSQSSGTLPYLFFNVSTASPISVVVLVYNSSGVLVQEIGGVIVTPTTPLYTLASLVRLNNSTIQIWATPSTSLPIGTSFPVSNYYFEVYQ